MKQWKNVVSLLLAAFIWGSAFVTQRMGMEYIEPFTFNGVRCLIGCVVLLPCIKFFDRLKSAEEMILVRKTRKDLWISGVLCGIILYVAVNAQQIGLQYTSAGKAGFITGLYIVLVPIFGIFLKQKINGQVWFSVLVALVGFYLLSMKDGFYLEKGDFFVLICALVYPFHILLVNKYAPIVDGVRLSCIQFLVCGGLSVITMFVMESPKWENILAAWMPLLYTGVMSCGVAYTLQIIGQKNFNPAVASLLMSFESVFSALCGWLILGEGLSRRELLGCGMIFAGVLLAQVPIRIKRQTDKEDKICSKEMDC